MTLVQSVWNILLIVALSVKYVLFSQFYCYKYKNIWNEDFLELNAFKRQRWLLIEQQEVPQEQSSVK